MMQRGLRLRLFMMSEWLVVGKAMRIIPELDETLDKMTQIEYLNISEIFYLE